MFRRLVVIAPALDFGGRLAVDAGTAEERGGGVAAGSTLKLKPCFYLRKLRDNAGYSNYFALVTLGGAT